MKDNPQYNSLKSEAQHPNGIILSIELVADLPWFNDNGMGFIRCMSIYIVSKKRIGNFILHEKKFMAVWWEVDCQLPYLRV